MPGSLILEILFEQEDRPARAAKLRGLLVPPLVFFAVNFNQFFFECGDFFVQLLNLRIMVFYLLSYLRNGLSERVRSQKKNRINGNGKKSANADVCSHGLCNISLAMSIRSRTASFPIAAATINGSGERSRPVRIYRRGHRTA